MNLTEGLTMTNRKLKVNIKEMFEEFAKNELEFIENSDPEKIYHRVIPNLKDKEKGTIDFLYKKIVIGGVIEKDTIYLNKLRVSKWGDEKDIDSVLAKINEVASKGDMKIVNQI